MPFFRFLFVWTIEYVVRSFLPNGVFYLLTTGWIFDISLCENSIKIYIYICIIYIYICIYGETIRFLLIFPLGLFSPVVNVHQTLGRGL